VAEIELAKTPIRNGISGGEKEVLSCGSYSFGIDVSASCCVEVGRELMSKLEES
jgi:hypothetical protein